MGLAGLDPLQRPEGLGQRVADELRRALMSGAFEPGARMTIRAVADALGVSLTPAREALNALLAEGVLTAGPNRVAEVPTLSPASLEELRAIRLALEGTAAEAAAPRLGDDDLDHLSQLHQQIERLTERRRYKQVMQANRDFHFHLYAAAGMPMLLRLIEGCWLKSGAYINLIYPAFGDAHEGIDNHAAAVAAARARDAKRLRRAVEDDIRFATQRLLEALSRHSPETAEPTP